MTLCSTSAAPFGNLDGPSVHLADVPWTRPVGPGWEVVLIPEGTARRAVDTLEPLPLDPIGAVFALDGAWGFFVPPESDDPPWPDGIRYLTTGASVTLPPLGWKPPAPNGPGWVRCGTTYLLTAPLLLHPLVTALPATRNEPRGPAADTRPAPCPA